MVLATPCSAPFLGTAVGFAFAGSGAVIVSIFVAIGFGLAAPVCLVALAPVTARLMPRSGPWMGKLRSGLGFALLASAVWTLWIFGRSAGVDALAGALVLVLVLALGAWLYGLHQMVERGRRGLALAAALVARHRRRAAPHLASAGRRCRAQAQVDSLGLAAVRHGRHRRGAPRRAARVRRLHRGLVSHVRRERAQGHRERRRAARRSRAATSRCSRPTGRSRDEAIRKELARFGRAGVPLYVVYDPAAPNEPRVLSELLTIDGLLDALRARDARGA